LLEDTVGLTDPLIKESTIELIGNGDLKPV
jgi:hypothetical protein